MSCFKTLYKTLLKITILPKFNNSATVTQIVSKCTMATKHNLIKPPECVRGMTVLEKEKFNTLVTISVLNLKNIKISDTMPYVKKYLFKMPHLKALQRLNSESSDGYLLLNPQIIQTWSDMNSIDRTALEKLSLTEANLSSTNLKIKYENYNADEIFKAVLPTDQEGFSSFSQVGHIIHLNLREHLFSFKNLIAEVLLDKIPNARTVVNKVNTIDNTYRNFQMEILRGDTDMMVKIKENHCEYEFDFSKVYWNTRLSTEHERIVKMLNAGDVLFDVFAGVGPFAIPAAKKKCMVFANDLNPESYKWLNHNLKKNKIDSQYLQTYNKDGRDFIVTELKSHLIKYHKNNVHIVMNLPALAVEFLSAFCELYKENEIDEFVNSPLIHVYCFAKGEHFEDIAKDLVFKNIGFDISEKIIDVFRVRTVSNFKEMMRVSFKLDKDILIKSNKRKHDGYGTDADMLAKKCATMGKNKAKQMKKVIKAVGTKNTKIKSKAKPVTSQLKRINAQNKSKIIELDKQLVELQDKVLRSSTNKKETVKKSTTPSDTQKKDKDFINLQKKSQKIMSDLNEMQIS